MSDKIKIVPSTMPRVQVAPSTMRRIDPQEVARALGAEIVERPKRLMGNSPELFVRRQQPTTRTHQLNLSEEDWDRLSTLAQELKEGEQPLSPELVGLQLLRQALELLEVKAQFKARLYAPAHAEAGE